VRERDPRSFRQIKRKSPSSSRVRWDLRHATPGRPPILFSQLNWYDCGYPSVILKQKKSSYYRGINELKLDFNKATKRAAFMNGAIVRR